MGDLLVDVASDLPFDPVYELLATTVTSVSVSITFRAELLCLDDRWLNQRHQG